MPQRPSNGYTVFLGYMPRNNKPNLQVVHLGCYIFGSQWHIYEFPFSLDAILWLTSMYILNLLTSLYILPAPVLFFSNIFPVLQGEIYLLEIIHYYTEISSAFESF